MRYVDVNGTNSTPPYTNWNIAAAAIQTAIDLADAGDLILVNDGLYRTGGRAVYGVQTNRVAMVKPLVIRSLHGPTVTAIEGFKVPATITGDAAVRCVYMTNATVLDGFTITNGATVSNGQISVEESGGGVWCESQDAIVTNCIFVGNAAKSFGGGGTGGTFLRCTFLRNSASDGGGAYLAALTNCSVVENSASHYGGGVIYSSLTGCILERNSATTGGAASQSTLSSSLIRSNTAVQAGGGTDICWMFGCRIEGNSAEVGGGANGPNMSSSTMIGNKARYAGGANGGELINSTVLGNIATLDGGGVYGGKVRNCILWSNTASNWANYVDLGPPTEVNFSCTLPLPSEGRGNITNPPSFVDESVGNYRLQSNSPCINSGSNFYETYSAIDLDGNPRIVGGTIDMGAYEFQAPASKISYAWLQEYQLPTDGSVDFLDLDNDGYTTWQEWRADTTPTNSLSVLRMLPPVRDGTTLTVSWQSVATRNYWIERATELPPSGTFIKIAESIAGQPGIMSYADTTATNAEHVFYRIGVSE